MCALSITLVTSAFTISELSPRTVAGPLPLLTSLLRSRPPRALDASHPFIDDLKLKDFVTSVPLSEEQICSAKLMRDFVSACRKMSPLVEFTTKALGLKF